MVREGVCWVKNVKQGEAQRVMRKTVIWGESVNGEEPRPFTELHSLPGTAKPHKTQPMLYNAI